MITPFNLQRDYGIEDRCPSRKVPRALKSYTGPSRSAVLSTLTALYHSGAMSQAGAAPKTAKRIEQERIAPMLGISRPTLTRRISMMSAPDRNWHDYCPVGFKVDEGSNRIVSDRSKQDSPPDIYTTRGTERRRRQSETMQDVVKGHPHWKARKHKRKRALRIPRQVGCFITRNKGFALANSYSLAMPADKVPQIVPRNDPEHDARVLNEFFGDMFDPKAYARLGVPTNGYDRSVGWNWHPNLPYLRTCSCRLGQKKFDFQHVCPKCEGKGFVDDGPMPDIGRYFYQTLVDLGLKKRLSRCNDCKTVWDQSKQCCPQCGQVGQVIKAAGILRGWTEKDLGQIIGCDVSTLRRYIRSYSYLGLIRVVPGHAFRLCEKCSSKHAINEACSKCGDLGKIQRHPNEYLDLTDRTMSEDIVKVERERLQASLRLHRRWLEQRQLEQLRQAVELAEKVLGEWSGHEHKLESFWNEMRRRLAASVELSRYQNVLFPVHRE